MAKYCGKVGFAETSEIEPGLYAETISEHGPYYGDIIRNSRRLQNSNGVNDDINITNQISIIGDPYANSNIFAMRYAFYRGIKWKITDVSVEYPRLILSLGGIYNENSTGTPEEAGGITW